MIVMVSTRSKIIIISPATWVGVSISCTKLVSKIKSQTKDEFELEPERVDQSISG